MNKRIITIASIFLSVAMKKKKQSGLWNYGDKLVITAYVLTAVK